MRGYMGRIPRPGGVAERLSGTTRLILTLGVVALAQGAVAAPASAEDPIEGIWSFGGGGRVAIEAEGNGTFTGTVVAPTRFAVCAHQVGERMWTEITPQGDGSYWGLHQWFFDTSGCPLNPVRGATAWRPVRLEGGANILLVCFSEPGSDTQPTIAPDGTTAGASYGCTGSAPLSALPEESALRDHVELPGNAACLLRRKLRIRIRGPRNDPLETVSIMLRAGKVRRKARIRRRGTGYLATFDLRDLPPAARFRIAIRLTTVLGHRFSRKRAYSRCAPPMPRPGRRHHAKTPR
jgi:hypothetical protein